MMGSFWKSGFGIGAWILGGEGGGVMGGVGGREWAGLVVVVVYSVRPARMRSSIPLLEPGPPRFFWWYENSE